MRKVLFISGLVLLAQCLMVSAQTTVTTTGGASGTIPLFNGTSTVANSVITQSNGFVGIGASGSLSPLYVPGQVMIGNAPYRGDASLHIGAAFGCCGRLFQENPSAGPLKMALNLTLANDSNGNGLPWAWGVTADNKWFINSGEGPTGVGFYIDGSSNVGIGISNPSARLEVNGNIKLSNSSGASIIFQDGTIQSTAWTGSLCGGDYAESVDVMGDRTHYEPGDVLVVDPNHPGHFLKAAEPYSTLVAGIYSTKPGLIGRRQNTDPKTSTTEVPMAIVGIVPTKVSAENGPIEAGDLLVTSATLGYAMKGTDRSLLTGAIVGKALGSLDSGTGVIEVLVSLQ